MENSETDSTIALQNSNSTLLKLENDNKKLRDEFDAQRAKLKDLFLQKEGELERKNSEYSKLLEQFNKVKIELDEAKNQILIDGLSLQNNANVEKHKMDEIASLQQLVHETIEESSTSKTFYAMEIKKLCGVIEKLEHENQDLKAERQHSPQLTSEAEEDVEVLRSLLVPLEEEIKALKSKLRVADEQLQKCQQCKHAGIEVPSKSNQLTSSTNTSFEAHNFSNVPCDMCINYETELVKEQQRSEEISAKLIRAEKAVNRHREELLKEIGFRKEIEEKWNEKKEQHKNQVAELTTRTDCAEQDLKELQDVFKQSCTEIRQHLNVFTSEREKVQQELEKLQRENDDLVGKYSIHSQQLQSEIINLPDNVEDLQELVLKAHQDVIIAKIGKEVVEKEVNNLRSDNLLLKVQITNDEHLKESMELSYKTQINSLIAQKQQLEKEKRSLLLTADKLESLDRIHQATLAQIDELTDEKRLLEDHINELKARVGSLQQELDNSETVQKDFVRLSQSLQVQLEKIRDSDTQVRWQHEEDVEDCPSCRSAFVVTKRKKQHCRHCGQIFCLNCLTHTVLSGPKQRPSRVCDVCHTLLVKSSAPYFSTEVPHSPD